MIVGFATWLREVWPEVAAVLYVALALVATTHAVLTKDEPRSTVGWVGLVWLSPFLGVILYYFLGINRIRRKAVLLMRSAEPGDSIEARPIGPATSAAVTGTDLNRVVQVGDRIGGLKLTGGNRVVPLVNGDEVYPSMLAAVHGARQSVALASYIFDFDDAGREFLDALARAVRRGVSVRVLIDAMGARYSFPSIVAPLRKAGVTVARFLPTLSPWRLAAVNLRSHRKILVVDGTVGFTGGMNIRQENYVNRGYSHPIQDLHFKVEGPVVAHLRQTFFEDWAFTTREVLKGETWAPPLADAGDVLARGVLDGPDRDFEKALWTILGGIAAARRSIRILTPYFLPDPTTVRFLSVAAMAGVKVEILVPARTNILLVQWAGMAILPELLRKNCEVFLAPPPFDHSKVMIVDETWAFIGSANWDSRSLRLNFEFNIECYDRNLAAHLTGIFAAKLAKARRLRLAELEGRGYPAKLRDGVVRLLAPYL